jgi:uridine kinase
VRQDSIEFIARAINSLTLGRPVRVAVDGRTASGKTTVADEIAAALVLHDRSVIRTSIDGFHRPKAERYARGRNSAEGYYLDARDLAAVRALLLDPLGPSGDLRYRTRSFDLEADAAIDDAHRLARADQVLIVDGTFLQRDELASAWDLVVFVDAPPEVAARRGQLRDAERLGGAVQAEALYRQRYQPAFEIYRKACSPLERADIVLDNTEFASATVRVNRT